MPEQHRLKRGVAPLMLTDVERNGSLVMASCVGCSPTRWYHPADLLTLYGDMPAQNLERIMRCGACGQVMNVRVRSPSAEELQKLRMRRLDKIWWVRRVSWRDE